MAASAILDFKNFKFLTFGRIKRAKLHHRAQFRRNRSNRRRDMAIFLIFQDGRRHLAFLNFGNFNGRNAQEGQTAQPCQISSKSVKQQSTYGDFSIFQDGGRHVEKSKNRHVSAAVSPISTKFG